MYTSTGQGIFIYLVQNFIICGGAYKKYLHLLRWVPKKCFDDERELPSEICFSDMYLSL